jgi:hypothetical protein
VLQRVATAAERAVNSYDRDEEAQQLAASLQSAVATSALVEVGAIGLGVGLAVLVGTAAADFTGITAALVIGGLGFGILPYRRHRAKVKFDERTSELNDKLTSTLRDQFERELEAGSQRMHEALAPYTRFVRVERERVTAISEQLTRIHEQTDSLRQRIESGKR